MHAATATVEIEITPPGPPGTAPWWTVLWNGTHATVRTAPGLDGDTPEDWGIACTAPNYTDAWRDEGGDSYVVEQILNACADAGANARIVAVHGSPEARNEVMTNLKAYADEQPQCAAELHRVAHEL